MVTIGIVPGLQALLGVPYAVGGRSREGADCLGIVLLALAELGIPARDPWLEVMDRWASGWRASAEAMPRGWVQVESPDYVPGDVLLCGDGQHVAIYAGGGYVLHSRERVGAHFTRLERLTERVDSAWRYRP